MFWMNNVQAIFEDFFTIWPFLYWVWLLYTSFFFTEVVYVLLTDLTTGCQATGQEQKQLVDEILPLNI